MGYKAINMRGFISFFLVVLFVVIIVIFLFIILLHVGAQIPVALAEEIKLMELGFNIKNMNSLLASKIPEEMSSSPLGDLGVTSEVYIPLIDLVMAMNFANESYTRKRANLTLYNVLEYYLNKNLSFGYCFEDKCYNCEYLINYPTKYGNIVMCAVEYPSIAAIFFNCGEI